MKNCFNSFGARQGFFDRLDKVRTQGEPEIISTGKSVESPTKLSAFYCYGGSLQPEEIPFGKTPIEPCKLNYTSLTVLEPEKVSCRSSVQEPYESRYTCYEKTIPERVSIGAYNEPSVSQPIELDTFRETSPSEMRPPSIDEGLGKRQESRDRVALEEYVVAQARWIVFQGDLCLYKAPCWRRFKRPDDAVREIRALFHDDEIKSSLTAADYKQIYYGLLSNPRVKVFEDMEPAQYMINCLDGTLDIRTMKRHPHTYKDNFFYVFPLKCGDILDPPMMGARFETYANQISGGNPDIRQQLLEMLAIAMTGTQLKYFYVMLGESHSGKSQWGRFMQELLGHENVESIRSIGDFGDRFTTGDLYGKLLVSCLDLPNGVLPQNAIGVLKTFCGDDSVKGEVKYKSSFTYYRKPLVMLAGNHPIRINQAAKETALLNRMIVVPFILSEHEKIDKLYKCFMEEAPYIVHEACVAFQELRDRNWEPIKVDVPEEFSTQEGNSSVRSVQRFVQDNLFYEADSEISTDEIYKAYCAYAEECGLDQLSSTAFSRNLNGALKMHISEACQIRRTGSTNNRGYRNIAFC